jgi:hypothetical protein
LVPPGELPRTPRPAGFLSEAETLIDGHPSMLPDDVFAPAPAGK